MVTETLSLAEARNHLTRVVRQVERGKTIGLSRRGRLVAVLVSEADFQRLSGQRTGFAEALVDFLAQRPRSGVLSARHLARVRDRGLGRPVKL
ncbi:MAG: type II toxin-antitoxin system Phd/YefM family antitoxin [Deltaproteobacteria bacterium]|nr:type II toxin-antitoxin system Phd/YefM family antitoxin [Deltaproteobacteria bacterium]